MFQSLGFEEHGVWSVSRPIGARGRLADFSRLQLHSNGDLMGYGREALK